MKTGIRWVVALSVLFCSLAEAQESNLASVNLFSLQPAAAGGGPVSAGTSFRFRAFGMYSQAHGEFDLGDDAPGAISNIDLEDNLGMDLDKFTGGVSVGFDTGRWHFDLSYNGYYDYSGTKDVGSIVVNGNVYTATVESSADVYEGAAHVGFDLWKSEEMGLTLTGVLDVHLYLIEAKLKKVSNLLRDSVELWAPVPALGAALRWDICPNFYARGSAAGIYVGELASYLDLSAELGYDLNRNVGVFVGYRYWLLNIDYSGDTFDFDNGMIYAGVELRM